MCFSAGFSGWRWQRSVGGNPGHQQSELLLPSSLPKHGILRLPHLIPTTAECHCTTDANSSTSKPPQTAPRHHSTTLVPSAADVKGLQEQSQSAYHGQRTTPSLSPSCNVCLSLPTALLFVSLESGKQSSILRSTLSDFSRAMLTS